MRIPDAWSILGGEPVSPEGAQEEPSDRKLCENEPAALSGGQPQLSAGFQKHRRYVLVPNE